MVKNISTECFCTTTRRLFEVSKNKLSNWWKGLINFSIKIRPSISIFTNVNNWMGVFISVDSLHQKYRWMSSAISLHKCLTTSVIVRIIVLESIIYLKIVSAHVVKHNFIFESIQRFSILWLLETSKEENRDV